MATMRERPDRPLIIAQRGASADAPENTIAAFELALEQGADGIALEVHLSRDDHPVVLRDFTLERTTDGSGPVRDRSVRELKRLDAGGWHHPRSRGQRVQTLLEVLERFRERTRFWIELRAGSRRYPGIEERVLSMLEIYEVVDRALVQSFDHQALDVLRGLSAEVTLGALVAGRSELPAVAHRGVVQALCPAADGLTSQVVDDLAQRRLGCYVWTVNEPGHAARLVEWGVSGLITEQPARLRRTAAG